MGVVLFESFVVACFDCEVERAMVPQTSQCGGWTGNEWTSKRCKKSHTVHVANSAQCLGVFLQPSWPEPNQPSQCTSQLLHARRGCRHWHSCGCDAGLKSCSVDYATWRQLWRIYEILYEYLPLSSGEVLEWKARSDCLKMLIYIFLKQYYTRMFNMYTYTRMQYHTVHAFVTLRHFDMSQGWQKLWPEQPARMSLWMIWAEIETITTEHKLNICKFSLSVMSSESVNQSTWLFCTIFVHMSSWAKEREIAIHQAHIRIRWFICKSDSLVRDILGQSTLVGLLTFLMTTLSCIGSSWIWNSQWTFPFGAGWQSPFQQGRPEFAISSPTGGRGLA